MSLTHLNTTRKKGFRAFYYVLNMQKSDRKIKGNKLQDLYSDLIKKWLQKQYSQYIIIKYY